jgi:hypothetical protein
MDTEPLDPEWRPALILIEKTGEENADWCRSEASNRPDVDVALRLFG